MELNLRKERIDRDWTLEYVGLQVGITRSAVYDIETGRRKPSYNVLCKLENLFYPKKHDYLFAVSSHICSKQFKSNNTMKNGKK